MNESSNKLIKNAQSDGQVSKEDSALTIPSNHFVSNFNIDDPSPYCEVLPVNFKDPTKEAVRISLPKPLAYFLTKEWSGSPKMRAAILREGRNELRAKIKSMLTAEAPEDTFEDLE
jgi:hypothetical protein